VNEPGIRERVRRLLETNRNWCAYALADLDPAWSDGAEWILEEGGVVLRYTALEPPVLFAHGEPGAVCRALAKVPAGEVAFTLQPTHRSLVKDRLRPSQESRMWRMVLHADEFPGTMGPLPTRLTPDHADAIERLVRDQPDRPDSFSVVQLKSGIFYGVERDGRLLSMAGTHVLSSTYDVAAIGNVFTDQEERGHGHGRAVTSAVVAELLTMGIGTIVLNVGMSNEAAVHMYRSLGFWPFCGYYEGVGWLAPP
jgi:ribosomal protein S18 acetylase RimI-like enzyme